MAIRLECDCGQLMQAPAGTEGRKLKCPKCGLVFEVPAAGHRGALVPILLASGTLVAVAAAVAIGIAVAGRGSMVAEGDAPSSVAIAEGNDRTPAPSGDTGPAARTDPRPAGSLTSHDGKPEVERIRRGAEISSADGGGQPRTVDAGATADNPPEGTATMHVEAFKVSTELVASEEIAHAITLEVRPETPFFRG